MLILVGFFRSILRSYNSTFRKLRFDRSCATTVLLSLASPDHVLSHPGYALFSPSSHTHFFLKTSKTFWKFHYILHYWTPSGPPSPPTTRIQNLHVVRVGINSGSFLMHSCEKNGLKDSILQKLEKSYTTLSTWQQFCRGAEEKEGNLPVQLSENWQNYM